MCNPELDGYALPKSDRKVDDKYHYPSIAGAAKCRSGEDQRLPWASGTDDHTQSHPQCRDSVRPMVHPVEVVGGELPCLTLGEFLMFGAGVAVGTFLTYFTMR